MWAKVSLKNYYCLALIYSSYTMSEKMLSALKVSRCLACSRSSWSTLNYLNLAKMGNTNRFTGPLRLYWKSALFIWFLFKWWENIFEWRVEFFSNLWPAFEFNLKQELYFSNELMVFSRVMPFNLCKEIGLPF